MAVVLVTGGTRGIGAACVVWFLANGDQVATTYRSADPPGPPEGADPERFLAVPCDVRNAEEVESAFATIEERWAPVGCWWRTPASRWTRSCCAGPTRTSM